MKPHRGDHVQTYNINAPLGLIRNELIINLRFWLDLFAASLVKKPRDSAAIPTFFNLLESKITSHYGSLY